ncbi:MAG: AAA family ATPase [Patescibacteria group bacterium]|jgi:predicted cytidylate kinase
MILTLSGVPGAGKSTVKNLLAERLNLKSYSIGDLRGEMAQVRDISIDELNELGMTDPNTDKEVDDYQKKLGQTEDNFIIDGLLSWFFIPQSFKIFLAVDSDVAAARIFKARTTESGRDDEPNYTSLDETKHIISKRMDQNRIRYAKWYGIDPLDLTQYDIVIDTTNLNAEQTTHLITAAIS